MRTTSADYKSAIYATERECRGYIKFNNDATKLIRGVDGLVSITLHEQLADEERPMFGGAVSRYVEVEFFNSGLPAGVSLANSYIDTYMGVVTKDTGTAPVDSIENDTATVEYIWNGRFYISEIDRSKLSTKVVAYDEFSKLNKQYVPTVVKGGSGYSVDDIAEDVLTQAGFVSTSVTLTGYVDELYEGTCRQMLSWVWGTNSLGCNLKMSRTAPTSITAITLDGAWSDKDNAENAVTDNEIYLGGLGDGDPFTVSSVTTGTEANPISVGSGTGLVGENPYLTSANANTILTNVGGITFKPMTIEFRGNPAIDTGDVLKVTSDGNSAYCWVQKMTTTFNGGIKQTIECYGDSEFYYSTEFNPTATHIKAAVSSMAQEIQHDIETADNGVITKVLDLDGSWKELVIANNQDLNSATSVWRWNINGLAHSTAYSGGTYNFAVDMNGRIIADVIQTGILTDANGYNSWNLDTGAFTITDGSINITTNSETTDKIKLSYTVPNYFSWETQIAPIGVTVSRTYLGTDPLYKGDSKLVIEGANINGYSSNGVSDESLTRGVYIGGHGSITLGGNSHNGSMTLYSGDYVLNTTGRWMTFQSISNNTSISMYQYHTTPNSPLLRITDREVRINDANGGGNQIAFLGEYNSAGELILGDGTYNRATLLPNRLTFVDSSGNVITNYYATGAEFWNGSSTAMTALLRPDSSGNGRLMLGNGTDGTWRTELTNSGLTFRSNSNAVTYTYPATGLWTKDVGSANMLDYTTFARETISSSGVITDATTRLLSPLIPVEQSTKYYLRTFSASRYIYEIHEYNSSRTWTGYSAYSAHTASHTTGASTYFVRVLARNSDNSAMTVSQIPNIMMRKDVGYTAFTPHEEWGADLAERFAFADWYIGSMTEANIVSMLNTQNTSLPVKKTIMVRMFGDSGANQTLIVNKASDNYGAAWPVGYYSQYRFELSAGTWYLKDEYKAPSVASYWSSGKANCPFIDTATPPNASSYWPTVGMQTPGGQWTIGRLGENLDLVYTATAQIGSSNNAIRYQLDGDASNASNLAYTILSSKNGALKPTHVSGGGTMSATTSYKYSGYSFTVPANKYFSVTAQAYYSAVSPSKVCISDSSSAINSGHMQVEGTVDSQNTRARITWTAYASAQITYYVWAQGATSGTLGIGIDGFYFS